MKGFILGCSFILLLILPCLAWSSDQQFDEDLLAGQISTLFEVQNNGIVMLCVAVSTYNPLRERGIPLQRRLLDRARFAIYDYFRSEDDNLKGVVIPNKYISTPKPRGSKWVSEYCVDNEKIIKIYEEHNNAYDNIVTGEKKLKSYLEEARYHEGLLELKPNDMALLKELLDIYREIGDYGKVNQIMDTMVILKRN